MIATHPVGRHRRDRPARVYPAIGAASCFGFAAVTGWLLALGAPVGSSSTSAPATAATAEPFHNQGEVIAVSPDSLSTVAIDGRVSTYRLTPDTARVAVAVQRDVVIHGELRNGVPIATAVVDRQSAGGDGAPMDFGLPG